MSKDKRVAFGQLLAGGMEVGQAAAALGVDVRLARHPDVIEARRAVEGGYGAHPEDVELGELIQMQRAVFARAIETDNVTAANTALKQLAQLGGFWQQDINVRHEHVDDQSTDRVVQALLEVFSDAATPVEAGDTARPVPLLSPKVIDH